MLGFNRQQFQWINLIWFNVIWFIAVYFNHQAEYFLIFSLLCHFCFTPTRRHDFWIMCSITLVGASGDSLLTQTGVMSFANSGLLPLWLCMLWAHFALAVNHGMAWLKNLPIYLQAILGGIFGPFSYYAGYKMGAVIFPLALQKTLFILAVVWFFLLPIYVLATKYFQGNKDSNQYSK